MQWLSTLVVYPLPVTSLQAISQLAAEVSVEDNLLGAELLWTPEDSNDVMDRDEMFLNFPELVTI